MATVAGRNSGDSGYSPAGAERLRWVLNRAGIINVYQYGNETLHFGGGRLLLRGVNGSGKSTAMNMLLPFLLDGDTRRIDAAGEQSGVLKAWMLSGRDEPQPQGYLWIEVARGDEYLTFGCGIRANRATDQVSTWWFITSRRPGIDLHLVEGRVPVSREALRTAIEPDRLFGQDERTDYRTELRRRLFGGADIEQHLHLLRIVRNPRVGDRLDAELPQYLQDALPQLSEAALDDAAQPLEDLEEHRKNVADLRRTADALDAIYATYRNYARTELHRLADRTLDAARVFRDRRRDEERARVAHDEALKRQSAAEADRSQIEAELERLRSAIAALEASEAYKSGAQLNDLRRYVGSLKRTVAAAEEALRRQRAAIERAANAVRSARQEASTEHDALRRGLSDLASLASVCRLTARPPSVPSISAHPDSPADLDLAAVGSVETAPADEALSALRAAVRHRIEEVDAVDAAVGSIELAERAVRDAEQVAHEAQSANNDARNDLTNARSAFQSVVEGWQAAAATWVERVRHHCAAHGVAGGETPPEVEGIVDEVILGHRVGPRLESNIAPAIRHHESLSVQREVSLQQQRELVTELEHRAAELAAKQLPDPPMLGWQQRAGRCLAELVDFVDHLDARTRAAVEGALEASGLLTAEVHSDGTLRLTDGQVVISSRAADVVAPLSHLLRSDVLDGDPSAATPDTVERILRAISTDLTANSDTAVSMDGEFRIGALRGKYVKQEAEHIGVTARRAALERQRAVNALAIEQAKGERDRLASELQASSAALKEALALRTEIPSDETLHAMLWQRNEAERVVEKSEDHLRARRSELQATEQRHAEAVAHAHAIAARLALPTVPEELRSLRADLDHVTLDSRETQRAFAQLARAVARWQSRSEEWRAVHDDQEKCATEFATVSIEMKSAEQRLTTLESTIGVAYQQVVVLIASQSGQLTAAQGRWKETDEHVKQAVSDVAETKNGRESAAAARERADSECVEKLGLLKRALGVPGLVEAGAELPKSEARKDSGSESDSTDATGAFIGAVSVSLPTVDDTPAGARGLAEAVHLRIPLPDEPSTSADGVRQSIRRRRDSLGAGWDAEDRQADESLPLLIEVTGPLAHQTPLPGAWETVNRQLATMSSLLSAKQQQALRNLLQGLVAREVADKLHSAGELIERMNERLSAIKTSHGIGVGLRWRRRDDLDPELAEAVDLLSKPPDLRVPDEDRRLSEVLGRRIDDAHREDPGTPYRELIARVFDYRDWHRMTIMLHRPGRVPERLSRRTTLSEGEKKIVSYLPLFAAVAASCDGLAAGAPDALRFVLLDDAFAKVSEDNHPKLFGLLVELDLDFIATSERLWGTHDTVPELAITEVIRDADLETIVLEHSLWNGHRKEAVP